MWFREDLGSETCRTIEGECNSLLNIYVPDLNKASKHVFYLRGEGIIHSFYAELLLLLILYCKSFMSFVSNSFSFSIVIYNKISITHLYSWSIKVTLDIRSGLSLSVVNIYARKDILKPKKFDHYYLLMEVFTLLAAPASMLESSNFFVDNSNLYPQVYTYWDQYLIVLNYS